MDHRSYKDLFRKGIFMPIPGLSLVGFMQEQYAIQYLQSACVPNNNSTVVLTAEWNAARQQIGDPWPEAGNPEILALPADFDQYVSDLKTAWPMINAGGWEIRQVEIDPLLAFQHSISLTQSDGHCSPLGQAPAIMEILPICLPLVQPPMGNIFPSVHPTSAVIRAENLNVRTLVSGLLNNDGVLGIQIGPSLPFVTVLKYKKRCYLTNGFHRTYGIRRRGASHAVCIFKETSNAAEVGIRNDGSTFGSVLLESSDPPTVGHYTSGRAWNVMLRKASKIIQVSWSEHTLPDE
jgi:hypothetical protein